jgi:hypothetical protein
MSAGDLADYVRQLVVVLIEDSPHEPDTTGPVALRRTIGALLAFLDPDESAPLWEVATQRFGFCPPPNDDWAHWTMAMEPYVRLRGWPDPSDVLAGLYEDLWWRDMITELRPDLAARWGAGVKSLADELYGSFGTGAEADVLACVALAVNDEELRLPLARAVAKRFVRANAAHVEPLLGLLDPTLASRPKAHAVTAIDLWAIARVPCDGLDYAWTDDLSELVSTAVRLPRQLRERILGLVSRRLSSITVDVDVDAACRILSRLSSIGHPDEPIHAEDYRFTGPLIADLACLGAWIYRAGRIGTRWPSSVLRICRRDGSEVELDAGLLDVFGASISDLWHAVRVSGGVLAAPGPCSDDRFEAPAVLHAVLMGTESAEVHESIADSGRYAGLRDEPPLPASATVRRFVALAGGRGQIRHFAREVLPCIAHSRPLLQTWAAAVLARTIGDLADEPLALIRATTVLVRMAPPGAILEPPTRTLVHRMLDSAAEAEAWEAVLAAAHLLLREGRVSESELRSVTQAIRLAATCPGATREPMFVGGWVLGLVGRLLDVPELRAEARRLAASVGGT